jgi:hypothetical protein
MAACLARPGAPQLDPSISPIDVTYAALVDVTCTSIGECTKKTSMERVGGTTLYYMERLGGTTL